MPNLMLDLLFRRTEIDDDYSNDERHHDAHRHYQPGRHARSARRHVPAFMWLDSRATPKDRVVDHQENAGADHSDENAVQIQARDACHAKSFEQEAARTAPTIPRMMSRIIPSPDLLTILLATNPAIGPNTIQAMNDISIPLF
jgi:hypothetical protein